MARKNARNARRIVRDEETIITELLRNEKNVSPHFTRDAPQEKTAGRGYSFSRYGIVITSLLSSRNYGVELVKRLKDAEGRNPDEVEFWGKQLGRLVRQKDWQCDIVTYPPSSEKRNYYLALHLAEACANEIEAKCIDMFVNRQPRGHRATYQEKLREQKAYALKTQRNFDTVLIIDDAIQTGLTLAACAALLNGAKVYAAILAGA